MLFWVIVKVGVKSLTANKLRSLLAMLGIVIGVGAFISMLALGAGAKAQSMQRIAAMGTNLLVVRPGNSGTGGFVSGTRQNLTIEDSQAITNEVANVAHVSPAVQGRFQVKYLNRNAPVTTYGVATTYLAIKNFSVERGRPFSESECENRARVAIIGPQTAENLFGASDPLGQTIKISGKNASISFEVIGVMLSKGDTGMFNMDDQVLVPYTTAMHSLMGVDFLNEIDVQTEPAADMMAAQDDVTALLRKRHKIESGKPEDFTIRNQADWIRMMDEQNQTFTYLLGGIASMSLLVGGIGIMNIMLVTVTERTREIGIRKAIGARRGSIRMQFLLESVIISVMGGLMGVGFGLLVSVVLPKVVPIFSTIVQWPSVALGLSFSVIVGVFFGLYPAWRAAALDPIVALRYE